MTGGLQNKFIKIPSKIFYNFPLPILLSRQCPMRHVLMILHLLLLLLGNCILLLFLHLSVIIALANINPCVRVDENLLKNSSRKLLRKSQNWESHKIFTITVSRHAARKLATSIKTKPSNPPSHNPRVATR